MPSLLISLSGKINLRDLHGPSLRLRSPDCTRSDERRGHLSLFWWDFGMKLIGLLEICMMSYPLVIYHSHGKCPICLPIKNEPFPMAMSVITRGYKKMEKWVTLLDPGYVFSIYLGTPVIGSWNSSRCLETAVSIPQQLRGSSRRPLRKSEIPEDYRAVRDLRATGDYDVPRMAG